MPAYYNEFDPYAAQWLRNLIAAGHIAPGDVDERSIIDVRPEDLRGYTQCHFFAGIGGWSYALRLAGWDDTRPVWTGSCPCQPFSNAGKQKAQEDERHLWPEWFRLISNVKPSTIFGEQVGGAIAHGWLDDAFDDLDKEGYQTGAAVLPACSVGAPHKRDRLWFVGYAPESTREWHTGGIFRAKAQECGQGFQNGNLPKRSSDAGESSGEWNVADANEQRLQGYGGLQECSDKFIAGKGGAAIHCGWEFEPGVGRLAHGIPARMGALKAYGNAIVPQVAAEFIKSFRGCVE